MSVKKKLSARSRKVSKPVRRVKAKRPAPLLLAKLFPFLAVFIVAVGSYTVYSSSVNSTQSSQGQVLGIFDIFQSLFSRSTSSSQPSTSSDKKDNVQQMPSSSGNRERGDAGEFYPYGKINEDTIAYGTQVLGRGGVLDAALSGNIHVYVVTPGTRNSDEIRLTPYYSMPTSKKAPLLGTELGYGFDLEYNNTRYDRIDPTYLVFDLDGGKTIEQIKKGNDKQKSFYCLPTMTHFQPYACAYLNKVSLTSHTDSRYAVVTPARDEHDQLIWMVPTIPMGYDNLLVVEIDRPGTYIPQKLTKESLKDIVAVNLTEGFSIPKIEALVQGYTQGVLKDEALASALSDALPHSPQEWLKIYNIYPKAVASLKNSSSDEVKNRMEYLEGQSASLESRMVKDLEFTGGEDDQASISLLTMLKRMEKGGISPAGPMNVKLHTSYLDTIAYFWQDYIDEKSTEGMPLRYFFGMHALLLTDDSIQKKPMSLLKKVFAQEGAAAGRSASGVAGDVGNLVANDGNASIRSMAEAAMAAAEAGNLELSDQIMDQIQKEIENKINDKINNDSYSDPIELLHDWQDYQLFGGEETDENRKKWIQKILELNKKKLCQNNVDVWAKNLKTFANQTRELDQAKIYDHCMKTLEKYATY